MGLSRCICIYSLKRIDTPAGPARQQKTNVYSSGLGAINFTSALDHASGLTALASGTSLAQLGPLKQPRSSVCPMNSELELFNSFCVQWQ